MKLTVIEIPQVSGYRLIALSQEHHDAIQSDPSMIDHVPSEAAMDVVGGAATWERPIGCADSESGRAAIRAHRVSTEDAD